MVYELDRAPGLLDLPSELLFRIASFLDKRSATNFARTARAFQKPSESLIWKTLSLTRFQTVENTASLVAGNLNERERASVISHLRISPKAWINSSRTLIQDMIDNLRRVDWRRTYLRELDLQLEVKVPLNLIDLLDDISPVLETLHIDFPTARSGFYGMAPRPPHLPRFTSLLHVMRGLRRPLTALKHVELYIDNENWAALVSAMLQAAPNLESLTISTDMRLIRNNSAEDKVPIILELPSLRKIIIQEMDNSVIMALTAIITRAPNLEHVALRDLNLSYQSAKASLLDGSILDRLSRLPLLKKLEISSNCFYALCELDGFKSVEVLSVLWNVTELKTRAYTNDYLIPPLPNLQKYQIQVSPYYTGTDYRWDEYLHPQLSTIQYLTTVGLTQLFSTPRLTIIYCPTYSNYPMPDFNRKCEVEQLYFPEANDRLFQGIAVRRFAGEYGNLVHCRSRFRIDNGNPIESGQLFLDETAWEEHAIYNGRPVPIETLAAVYAAEGLAIESNIEGRSLQLGEESTKVLQRWEMQRDESSPE
ncbi:hypothetical protein AYX13_03895 [Cryptococcus neoformans]|nr:hypothetical protein AYX13_03895 [Cryptococcus neoformans var. grubii]